MGSPYSLFRRGLFQKAAGGKFEPGKYKIGFNNLNFPDLAGSVMAESNCKG